MELLIDRDIGIDKYLSFVVLKSPIVKAYRPLDPSVGAVLPQRNSIP
jgi:hypothetical protein